MTVRATLITLWCNCFEASSDMNLVDVLTKSVPRTFERLVKLWLDTNRGEYFVKVADEKVNYVTDEKTWMVTDML